MPEKIGNENSSGSNEKPGLAEQDIQSIAIATYEVHEPHARDR